MATAVGALPAQRQRAGQFEIDDGEQLFAADHADGAAVGADLVVGRAGLAIVQLARGLDLCLRRVGGFLKR